MAVAPGNTALATLDEAKLYVWREATHTADEQDLLCLILNGVSDAVHQYLGNVMRQTYTEKYDGGTEWLALRHYPVVSVSNVKELDLNLTKGQDYLVYPELWRLRRLGTKWLPLPQAIEVTYEAGWAVQERDATGKLTAVVYHPGGEGIRQAVLVWCYELWHAGPSTFADLVGDRGIMLRPEGMPPAARELLACYVHPIASVVS